MKNNFKKAKSLTLMRLARYKHLAFFSTFLYRTPIHIDEKCPTCYTDGKDIYVNPDYFLSLTTEERMFALLHEVMHIALLHHDRRGNRQPTKWNIATDFAINIILKNNKLPVPQGCLYDAKYINKTAEIIYNELPNGDDDKNKYHECTCDNDFKSIRGNSSEITDEVKQRIAATQNQLEQSNSFDIGKESAELQRTFNQLEQSKVNWKNVIYNYLKRSQTRKSSWKKPNRKLPGLIPSKDIQKKATRLDLVVDTSGSVSDKELNFYINEALTIFNIFKPREIGVTAFDWDITSEYVVNNSKDIREMKLKGGGGTRVHPAINKFKDINTELIIVLTDGYIAHMDKVKNIHKHVLWCLYGDYINDEFDPPYGQVLTIPLK